jgi:predicted DNA-binding protein (UPF0251 family)
MARPPCCRRVEGKPPASVFRPAGSPACGIGEIVMTLDEFEAIRLADLEGLYQERAAGRMKVSRPTFGRLVESGRRKVAEALFFGKALRIGGGPVHVGGRPSGRCPCCSGRGAGCRRCGGRGPVPLAVKEGGSCRCVRKEKVL